MSAWLPDETTLHTGDTPQHCPDVLALLRDRTSDQTAQVTAAGAAWLAGATAYPRSTLAQWEAHPTSPGVLPCGSAFDVVNVPTLFGRRMLEHLWSDGPGSGPVATHRGRMLLFASPGTAQRLPSLLDWEEWGGGLEPRAAADAREQDGGEAKVPPLLCHGTGDAVTVPPLTCTAATPGPRWVVAPDTRGPWLPGPDVLLWACVRVTRSTPSSAVRNSIFPPADQGANVYDVSRRR
ncbi:bifunctional DNA primase/polymerase [Streptomyces sp. NPDC056178]|uniref:bifunctional DNA primase/polymerase n=1 Tax=unclassified Streptomyces TaxID=2593676 RepID=UPI0035DA129F